MNNSNTTTISTKVGTYFTNSTTETSTFAAPTTLSTTSAPVVTSVDVCANYRASTPTALFLLKNGGPDEYYPLLGIACFFLFLNTLVYSKEVSKHSKFFRDAYFKLSSRVFMIMSSFWVYGATSLLGMIFVRGNTYLHFVSHAFESACMLAFFDCIVIHKRSLGFILDGTRTFSLRAPPCCCCLFCLPTPRNTKRNIRLLRACIFQLVFFQTFVEFIRVLTAFDCAYDPQNTRSIVFDALVVVSFLLSLWALSVAVKVTQKSLAKFRLFHKFAVFKLMIFISKAVYNILQLVAKNKLIPAYESWLGGETRAAIWANFVTVVAAAVLMFFNAKLYNTDDYETIGYTQQVQFNTQKEAIVLNDGAATDENPCAEEIEENIEENKTSSEAIAVDLHVVGIENEVYTADETK